jgi:hypothetical protein
VDVHDEHLQPSWASLQNNFATAEESMDLSGAMTIVSLWELFSPVVLARREMNKSPEYISAFEYLHKQVKSQNPNVSSLREQKL